MNTETAILYIEDDEYSLEVMKILLLDVMGFQQVTLWADSQNVIQRLRALKPQPGLILMDIHMYPDDGYTMMNKLREKREFADMRVVAVTASFMKEEKNRLEQAGFDGGIAKPIDRDTFPEVLRRILEGDSVWHVSGEQWRKKRS